jgi:hypothetical protein
MAACGFFSRIVGVLRCRVAYRLDRSGTWRNGGQIRIIGQHLGLARQYMSGLLAHDQTPFHGRESSDEADFPLLSTGLVPRNPHAVRMPQFRLAVMRGELVLGEDEFAVGFYVVRIAILLVEGVNDQGAIDLDGVFLSLSIEDQSAAESAHGRFVALIENRIRPIRRYLGGHSRLLVGEVERPNLRFFQAQRSTACENGEQQGEYDDREMISRHDSSHFFMRREAPISDS